MKNKRTLKNIVMIVLAAALIAALVFTTGIVRLGSGDMQQMPGGGQPGQTQDSENGSDQNQDSQTQSDDSSQNQQDNGSSQQPPEKPDGDSAQAQGSQPPSGDPPEKPDGDVKAASADSSDNSSAENSTKSDSQSDSENNADGSGSTPPEKPDGDSGEAPSGEMPEGGAPEGEMPSGDMPSGDMPQPGQGGQPGGMSIVKIILTTAEGLALAFIILYLIMSGFNRKTFRETLPNKKKTIIFIVIAVVAGAGIGAAGTFLPMKLMNPGNMAGQMPGGPGQSGEAGQDGNAQPGEGGQDGESSVTATGATTVDGESKTLNEEYTSKTADESAVLVTNGGKLTSDGASISKNGGDGTNTDNCDFNGINAALLVNSASAATIKNATIKTSADKSNGVFATGKGSTVTISDSKITTTGDSSARGLDATYNGKITADNVTVSTKGGSCAALATDRGGGTVTAKNSNLSTEGAGSPLIYSTGEISISKTEGTASGGQIAVVEGKNSAKITNSDVSASAAGNRGDVDVCGIMLYQSMSGDADKGTSIFTAKNSTLSIDEDSNYYDSAPMFFITNTSAKINLKKSTLNFGSDLLMSIKGTSEWGTEDKNGGKVSMTAAQQTLKGDIELDSISKLSLTLREESSYTGAINTDNKAKSVKLKLSRDSQVKLTGDTYVSSIDDEDESYSNIDLNGHKLYVNGKEL